MSRRCRRLDVSSLDVSSLDVSSLRVNRRPAAVWTWDGRGPATGRPLSGRRPAARRPPAGNLPASAGLGRRGGFVPTDGPVLGDRRLEVRVLCPHQQPGGQQGLDRPRKKRRVGASDDLPDLGDCRRPVIVIDQPPAKGRRAGEPEVGQEFVINAHDRKAIPQRLDCVQAQLVADPALAVVGGRTKLAPLERRRAALPLGILRQELPQVGDVQHRILACCHVRALHGVTPCLCSTARTESFHRTLGWAARRR